MTHRVACLFALLFSILGVAGSLKADDKQELDALLDSMDNLWIEKDTYAELSMKVKTAHYERELRLHYWGKGKDYSLIRIVHPPKESGVSTLKAGKDVYNYVPKIARTTKISDALMSQSWMGSHFLNSDLVRATRLKDDYEPKLLEKKKAGTQEIWVIEALAKPSLATLQKRLVILMDKQKRLPIEQKIFDKDQNLLRTLSYQDVKNFDGKSIPSRVRVDPADPEKKGEFTEIIYEKIDSKRPIPESTFSLVQLAAP